MKELTPSGWIGVLIGIVVFGSLVGHVAAQKKCWQKAASPSNKLEKVEDLKKAFDRTTWTLACDGTDICLQYFPKTLDKGKLMASMQCGATCGDSSAVKTAVTAALGGTIAVDEYECSACDTSAPSACKDFAGATKNADTTPGKKCYSLSALQDKASVTNVKTVPQIFCNDDCQSVTRASDGKIFVGCASDCNTHKGADNCAKCVNKECEKLIFAAMCYKKAKNQNLDTVQLITDAYNVANWRDKCDSTDICLQYYPDAGKTTGKVSLLVECGSTCATKTGYKCHPCDSRDSDSCKKLTDVTGVNECFEFDNDKQTGDSTLTAKIYCFDKCQYKDNGAKVKVGCAKDVKDGTDCPATDLSCVKMIFKPTDPIHSATGGGGATTPSGGAITPSGGTTTTTRPKTSNKLTISKYLLGSLATLLFATNQYMRQF